MGWPSPTAGLRGRSNGAIRFDLTVFQELDVDHGLTVPLSIYCPNPGDAWPCRVVPVMVNVIQYPQPTAARCYALGKPIGRAVASFDAETTVAVFGTGGMSHQLAGGRAGFINADFDAMFLEAIETDPEKLAASAGRTTSSWPARRASSSSCG